MIITLVPPNPEPTVLFSLTFANLPSNLPTPPAWANQIAILNIDDLDLPHCLHALDKSAATTTLLHEVTFDIPTLTISCVFVDGVKEEWPLMGAGCMGALESVLHDVNESAAEADREQERELARQQWREYEREQLLAQTMPPPTSTKPNKHKKQRSLLMSLVASLVPSVRSPSPPPPPHPPLPSPAPPPHLSSRSLRLKARSTLVDTYRRHVLTELARRTLPGGYYTWVARSMLRRISERMDELVRETGMAVLVEHRSSHSHEGSVEYLPTLVPPSPSPSPSSLDSGDTDTDGSSLHTPTSSSSYTPSTSNASMPLRISPGLRPESCPAGVDGGQGSAVTPEVLAEYSALSAHTQHIRNLLMLAGAKAAHDAREAHARETMLEVRCRRRAWLSRRLGKGVSVGIGIGVGMAQPFERSPLGLRSWVAADVEVGEEEEEVEVWNEVWNEVWHDGVECIGQNQRRWRFGRREPRLFPVSEEDEDNTDDEGAFVARELALDMDLELDLANGWVRSEDDNTIPMDMVLLERPKVLPRIRMRTSSMYMRRRCLDSVDLPMGTTPLLFSPLRGCAADVEGVELFGHEEEFTLAMDLPGRRQGRGVDMGGYEREEVHERRWMAPALGVIVDCR